MGRLLIAGAGFVGLALARAMANDHEVFVLRRRAVPVPEGCTLVQADLNADLSTLPPGLDLVAYTASADDGTPEAYRRAYVDGPRRLLDAVGDRSPKLRRVVFTSSTAVYGQTDGSVVDETSETAPTSPSGQLMLEGESAFLSGPFSAVVLRLGGIYGPGRHRLIESVRRGEASYPEGDDVFTNRNHRDDCAAAVAHLLAHPSPEPVYLGTDLDPAPRREVLEWLARRLGAPMPTASPGPRRRGGNKRCSSRRLQQSGFRFRYPSYRDGYAAML